LGVLGHDLRNPLNAITMAAQMLARQQTLPGSARERAVRIEHAASRMGEMIRTLLDFTHARFRGGLPIVPSAADLRLIAHEVVAELRSAWPDRDIELAARGDLRGHWDAPRIAQVVSNLVANALSHGARATPVHVLVSDQGAEVWLVVHNVGVPIPPELLPVLFEPFRRGAGDGLYIARQIIDAHGGNIEVTSTAAEGTRFILRLPRIAVGATREGESRTA
jgi:signal transduction histidine kinase